MGDEVSFEFIEDGLKVRLPLEELMTAADETETLKWHVGVRRLSFANPDFSNTVGVVMPPMSLSSVPSPRTPLFIPKNIPAGSHVRFHSYETASKGCNMNTDSCYTLFIQLCIFPCVIITFVNYLSVKGCRCTRGGKRSKNLI